MAAASARRVGLDAIGSECASELSSDLAPVTTCFCTRIAYL
jgi:hypothetical protein